MKITGKVKIKDITANDIATIVNNIANSIIFKEDGEIVYQPYFFDDVLKMSIFVYLIEGVELEEDDKILDILKNDKIIKDIIDDFMTNDDGITEIMGHAYDMIDFKKQLYLSQNDEINELLKKAIIKENALNDMLLELAKSQNKVLLQQAEVNEKQEEIFSKMSADELALLQKRIANGEFNMSDMIDMVVDRYMENDKTRDQKYKEIIDEKNKTIVELKDHLKKGGQ